MARYEMSFTFTLPDMRPSSFETWCHQVFKALHDRDNTHDVYNSDLDIESSKRQVSFTFSIDGHDRFDAAINAFEVLQQAVDLAGYDVDAFPEVSAPVRVRI